MNTQSLVPRQRAVPPATLDKSNRQLAIRRGRATESDPVPHISIYEVRELARVAAEEGKGQNGSRDQLLIETLFDACLRVSELVGQSENGRLITPGLRPIDLLETSTGWAVRIIGKGSKAGEAAISPTLAARLQAYAYRRQMHPKERLFPITRARAHQICERAFEKAGIAKPAHVGAVHILRHSGAIARLEVTGNPKAVQDQLRHKQAYMTLRYFKTLTMKESLEIQKGVEFGW